MKVRKEIWQAEKRLLGGSTDHFLLPPGSLLRDVEDLRNIVWSYSWLEGFRVTLGIVYFLLLVYLVQHPSLEAVQWDATLLLFTFTIGILVVTSVWNLVHFVMINCAVSDLHIFAFKTDLLQKIEAVRTSLALDGSVAAKLEPPHTSLKNIRHRFWRLQFYFSEPSLLHDYVQQLSLHPKPEEIKKEKHEEKEKEKEIEQTSRATETVNFSCPDLKAVNCG